MKDKNVYILHGCPSVDLKEMDIQTSTYDKHWIQWLKQELTARNIPAETPRMPLPWAPVYEQFKKEFDKYRMSVDDILVAHSCSSAFLIRWLADTEQRVSKLILVAPWCVGEDSDEEHRDFFEHPIDPSVKDRVDEIVIFTSDNEEVDGKKSVDIINSAIGGKIINLKGRGHYTQNDMGTNEFPELLQEILKNAKDLEKKL